jgi:hypothetical protein
MPRRSSSSDSLRRLALLAVAAGLAAGIAAAGARMTQRRRSSSQTTYRCRCGSKYRVSGTDRHRVYWAAGASESDPVLGDRCPNCDAPLPSGHEGAVV